MALDNPAFKRNPAFSSQGAVAAAQDVSAQQLQEMYNQPATLPDREVMTYDDAVQKAAISFGLLLVGAAIGWFSAVPLPFLWIGAGIVGFVLALVNVILMWTGVNDDPWGLRGAEIFGIPLGLIIGVLVVIMAAYSLVQDFDMIQQGVRNGAPRKYGWLGGFGIMVTVIWLYVEILRILAIARN